jgi:hypothetical protein
VLIEEPLPDVDDVPGDEDRVPVEAVTADELDVREVDAERAVEAVAVEW